VDTQCLSVSCIDSGVARYRTDPCARIPRAPSPISSSHRVCLDRQLPWAPRIYTARLAHPTPLHVAMDWQHVPTVARVYTAPWTAIIGDAEAATKTSLSFCLTTVSVSVCVYIGGCMRVSNTLRSAVHLGSIVLHVVFVLYSDESVDAENTTLEWLVLYTFSNVLIHQNAGTGRWRYA